ncbi:MAG: glutamate formimidoyltransferase, partial [Candidatus Dadabacteria bacterium]
VSALAGALSASLTAMVSALTHAKAKKREQEKKDLLEKLGIQAQQLAKTLTMAIDDDTAAFNRVMSAFRIKAATEEEEKHKEASIIAAYREATSVPLKVAEACHQALKLSLEALKHGMQSAFSDAAVASQMAFAGFLGAGYNVRINLNELRSFKGDQSLQEYVNQTETALKKMNTDAIALIEEANKIVHQHFNP